MSFTYFHVMTLPKIIQIKQKLLPEYHTYYIITFIIQIGFQPSFCFFIIRLKISSKCL